MILDKINKNPLFLLSHLSENDNIENFIINKKDGYGLLNYLKNYALDDEKNGIARTYLVKDSETKDIVAYFTLRTGLITVSKGFMRGFDAYTGIELANFAVNDLYRELKDTIPQCGSYIFKELIHPLVKEISRYVGAKFLYIYALPNGKLMEHYKTMGFTMIDTKTEKFVYRHVKPVYDKGCRFMFQSIE